MGVILFYGGCRFYEEFYLEGGWGVDLIKYFLIY